MITRYIALLLAVVAPAAWSGVSDLSSLQQQLSKHDTVRGEFTQLRHIEMFDQPLSSQGVFTLNRTKGSCGNKLRHFQWILYLLKISYVRRFLINHHR
ncbi:transmembrane protein [Vibrio ishigakensis]|uniref:Transmembrane protein n=1 Tax=Vibrio ishigakensis TaxID=1481914 RepID=A0A0B8QEQ9_9VIBR|nr:transmembrane protein [Vibrio ishigakensis]